MAPVLLCFAFAMITLEEIDDKVSRYFSITPLGKAGYLFTRLGVPSIISAVIAFIVLLLFSLEKVVHWNDNMFGASRLSTGNYCFTYDYHIIKQ